jgi:uncharacterized OsmC-like protein
MLALDLAGCTVMDVVQVLRAGRIGDVSRRAISA